MSRSDPSHAEYAGSVQLHFAPRIASRQQKSIEKSLADAGLLSTVKTRSGPRTVSPVTLLFFAEYDDELGRNVFRLSRHSHLLAISLAEDENGADTAFKLLQCGARDVLRWNCPEDIAPELICRLTRWAAIDKLIEQMAVRSAVVGDSPRWRAVVRNVIEVAHTTRDNVLLSGQTGTGKEVLARLIHEVAPDVQRDRLYVLDCTTIVPELAGSEFFGHERGAFTGAISARDGAFAFADGGTLFLDEIGELSLPMQAQLLRVIQEGTYHRVGSSVWRKTRFRLVTATNKDLPGAIQAGRFRSDLYYRIAHWHFELPPLSERREDIPLLTEHFIRQSTDGAGPMTIDPQVLSFLMQRAYPGNVRELKHLVMRIVHAAAGSSLISAGCVPENERKVSAAGPPPWPDEQLEMSLRSGIIGGASLTKIIDVTRELAIRCALSYSRQKNGSHQLSRAQLLSEAAAVLGCTKRWLEECDKKYALFDGGDQ